MKRLLLALLALAAAAPARAGVEAAGYLKNLFSYTRSPLTRAPYNSDLTRARLNLDARARGLGARVEYDHELRLGSFLRSRDFQLGGLGEPPSHFDLDQTISSGTDAHYRHRLYRGFVEAERAGWHLRFGRQRIAWGTGKLWNPTDFLNPFEPTSLEREERRGVDAVYLRRGLGQLGQGELVYALARRWDQSDLVARARGNAGGADVSLSGGKVVGSSSSWTLGADLALDLYGGTVHAELGYTELRVVDPFVKAMVGYEYSFSQDPPWPWLKDLWLAVEYYHNGNGEGDPRRYNRAFLLSGREVGLARDYLGAGLRRELHPLLQVELYAIGNLTDQSQFLAPSATWNALPNLYLSAGWQRYGGGLATEYGALPNLVYLQAQYFF